MTSSTIDHTVHVVDHTKHNNPADNLMPPHAVRTWKSYLQLPVLASRYIRTARVEYLELSVALRFRSPPLPRC